MTVQHLTAAFDRWREAGEPLVLATVFETAGSTYSKTGAQMLINSNGDFQGMLSGGCLEGDLAERSNEVLRTGLPQLVTYDLTQNDEALWGLGVGCDGLMRILLQPLRPECAFEPFASMCEAYAGDSIGIAATVLESTDHRLVVGASWVSLDRQVAYSDIDPALEPRILQIANDVMKEGQSRTAQLSGEGGETRVLFVILRPPPRILVLGAGLDANPVVRLAVELGWRVIVQDHRPAYIEAGQFAEAEAVYCVPPEELATTLDWSRIDAVIVMSHHLVTDSKYLRVLAGTDVRYIALLGPANRRERLLRELGNLGAQLRDRVHGPAGIDIGGSGPASIALSIIAQVHQVLHR